MTWGYYANPTLDEAEQEHCERYYAMWLVHERQIRGEALVEPAGADQYRLLFRSDVRCRILPIRAV